MYYKIDDENIYEASLNDALKCKQYMGVLNLNEFNNEYKSIGLNDECMEWMKRKTSNFKNCFEVYENYSIATISILNTSKKNNKITLILRKDSIIVVILKDTDNFASDIISETLRMINNKFSFEKFIVNIFNKMISGNMDLIDKYEDLLLKIEDRIVNNNSRKSINQEIFRLKKTLSQHLKYYKSLMRLVEMLHENNNNVFEDEEFKLLNILDIRVERAVNDLEYIMEDLKHIQDLYDASLDYSQNNIMTLFTVVTTIFLPLTLITGWYGMNFKNMPEITWKYGYISVIVLSIFIVSICIFYFKKKKLL